MKDAAEAIDRLLSQLGTLLRYVAPGFAALYVVAAVIPSSKDFLKADAPQVLVLGMLLGFAIYAVHTAVVLRVWWFPIMWLHENDSTSFKLPKLVWFVIGCLLKRKRSESKRIWYQMSNLDHQRWLRRASEEKVVLSIQKEMDKWAAMQHFLYCLSYSMILVPLLALTYPDPNSDGKLEGDLELWWWGILLGGCFVLIVALISEYRITGKEIELNKRYPDGEGSNYANVYRWQYGVR